MSIICVLQSLEQPHRKFFLNKYNWYAKGVEKMESCKILNKTREAWKNGKQKQNRNKRPNKVTDGKQLIE